MLPASSVAVIIYLYLPGTTTTPDELLPSHVNVLVPEERMYGPRFAIGFPALSVMARLTVKVDDLLSERLKPIARLWPAEGVKGSGQSLTPVIFGFL